VRPGGEKVTQDRVMWRDFDVGSVETALSTVTIIF
jgi:hypothetical protein